MGKITLTEQLEQLKAKEILIRDNDLNDFFMTIEKPKQLFKVDNIGVIKEIELTGFNVGYYANERFVYTPYFDESKRPTKALINCYNEFLETIENSEKVLFVNYKDFGSGSYKFNEVIAEKGISFNESDLLEISEIRKNVYAPKENHTACSYCRKQTPNDKLIESTIIGRGRKQVWNSWKSRYESKACATQERLKFCSGNCAGNEQMSREG